MSLKPATFALLGLSLLIATLGCERQDEEPHAPDPAPATTETEAHAPETTAEETGGATPEEEVVAMLRGEQPKPKPKPAEKKPTANNLPPGHPPISTPGAQSSSPHGMGMPRAQTAALSFTAPEAWIAETPHNSMRHAQYRLPGEGEGQDGELVVFFFGPGQGGDNKANIERWMGQFTKPDGSPLTEDDVKLSKDPSNKLPITTIEFAGTYNVPVMRGGPPPATHENYRLIAGIIEVGKDRWFVKATGPDETMVTHREKIHNYLLSAAPSK